MTLQTIFEFELPLGYQDAQGTLHKQGAMRMATAMDEIAPIGDPRVRENEAYMVIVLLSRVVIRLGSLPAVNTHIIESLFAADLAYLQALYQQVNETGKTTFARTCPNCGQALEIDLAGLGGA